MKKRLWLTLTVFLLILSMTLPLFSCTDSNSSADTAIDSQTETTPPSTEEPTEESTEISTEAPAETTEEPTEAPTEEPTNSPVDTPEEPTESETEVTTEPEPEPEPEPVEPVSLITYETLYKATEGEENTLWKQNTATLRDGYVTLTSGGIDPWIVALLEGKTADGEAPAVSGCLAIKYRTDYSVAGQINLTSKRSKNFDFYWVGNGQWNLMVVNLSRAISTDSPVSLLRLDYAAMAGMTIDIQYVAFFNSKEDAISYDTTVENPVGSNKLAARPDFKVSGVFSSHMVLQRDTPIHIWGFSNVEGSTVTATFDGETVTTQVTSEGKWEITFSARPYSKTPRTMTISDDRGHETVMEDILIGDVWLVGGQSNAELTVAPCVNYTQNLDIDENDAIRLFTQTQAFAASSKDKTYTPQEDIINPAWGWKTSNRQAVYAFSALGYFCAKEIYEQTDIPQGFIMIAAGGACLSELLPAELAHDQGYTAGGNVREGGYYNTLIHPFVGLSFKGMLFFQGESEGIQKQLAEKYAEEMALLVSDERTRFGNDFPFYFVQLSDYLPTGAQYFPFHDIVRVQQTKALEIIPNSTMIVAMDLGAPAGYGDWAHSPLKAELGRRMAKVILAKEYGIGEESEVSSPRPVSVTLSADKKQITIEFSNVGEGLAVLGLTPAQSIGQMVAGFSVGPYTKRVEATATITSKNTIVVDVPDGANPTYVNYAFFMTVTTENANLRNGFGLPAAAFSVKIEQ